MALTLEPSASSTILKRPFVSVVIPCRNEEAHIRICLDAILHNGYPLDRMEVLVVDGMSTDGTREVVALYREKWPNVRMLDNPKFITPVALNIGIHAARGDWLLRMDAHNACEPGYIAACVEWGERTGADNVGGGILTVARTNGLMSKAIVTALTHPFGVGGSDFRLGGAKPKWTDTVFGGCFRRHVFERVGFYNEHLARGQDMELNLRLRKAGLRTLLVPSIRSVYYARTRLSEFLRHNWTNGLWAVLPFRYSEVVPVSGRHLVPCLFAGALAGATVLTLIRLMPWWFPVLVLAPYCTALVLASVDAALRRHSWRLLPLLPLAFVGLHIPYGFGSLWGAIRIGPHLLSRSLGRWLSRISGIARAMC